MITFLLREECQAEAVLKAFGKRVSEKGGSVSPMPTVPLLFPPREAAGSSGLLLEGGVGLAHRMCVRTQQSRAWTKTPKIPTTKVLWACEGYSTGLSLSLSQCFCINIITLIVLKEKP